MNNRGSTIVEVSFILVITVGAAVGVGNVLKTAWQRMECSRHVFEAVQNRLSGKPVSYTVRNYTFSLTDHSDRVSGEGHCGKLVEKLELPKLESAQWD